MKELVAKELAKRVKDGEIIGVGTGSTVDLALREIGARVKNEGLRLKVVPTSLQSSWQCHDIGLDVLYPQYRGELAWGFDGADEVDERLMLIKGKGGALLQEKLLAARCKQFVIIVDDSKVVKTLGAKCPIPVEVIPEGYVLAEKGLKKLGAETVTLRNCTGGKHGPVITEAGNIILDAHFMTIPDDLEPRIKEILGVVESGLFTAYAQEVLVASKDNIRTMRKTR